MAVGIDRDFADLIHARYPEGGVDDLLRLALAHPDFDTRFAGDIREPFTLFETADEAVVAILRRRDDTLAGADCTVPDI